MSKIHCICPAGNISKEEFDRLTAKITPHLDRAGVCFTITDTASETAIFLDNPDEDPEKIARRIIEADGKEFIPITAGEYIDEVIRLGLFPANTDWDAAITKEEVAILAARLIHLLRI